MAGRLRTLAAETRSLCRRSDRVKLKWISRAALTLAFRVGTFWNVNGITIIRAVADSTDDSVSGDFGTARSPDRNSNPGRRQHDRPRVDRGDLSLRRGG